MSDVTNQNTNENTNQVAGVKPDGTAGTTYNQNPGQVVMPAPERHQTVTYVDNVNVSGRYTSNEYTAPVQPVQPIQFSQQPQPVQQTPQPVQQTAQPVQQAAQPVQQAAQPAQQTVQPVQQAAQPVQQTAQPVQQAVQPVQQTAQPVRTNPVPVASTASPAPFAAKTQSRPMPEAAPAPFSAAAAVQTASGGTNARTETQTQSPSVNNTIQNSQSNGENNGKKEKKGPNFFVKLLMAAAMGLVFGLIAGGVILLMVKLIPNNLQALGNPSGSEITSSGNPTEPVSTEPGSESGSESGSEISSEAGTLVVGGGEGIATTEVTEDMTVPEVAQECMPAVVIINTLVDYNYYGMIQEVPASGTGVIVGMNEEDLFIATNYHVVEGAKEIKVQFCDSSTANAEVKGKKVAMDLAVITIDVSSLGQKTKDAIKFAKVGDSDKLVVGESCVAIGNALGYGQSVTYGVISALDREVTTEKGETGHFIQTDAAINPGNSGGALLNMRGELIGINSNKLGGTVVEGMGYAIPINTARPIIQTLIEKKELQELPEEEQSYFGISGATVKSGLTTTSGVIIPEGIYVTSVAPDSPADKAGIQKGDIITEFEGESVVSTAELMQFLASYPSGAKVTITYRRLENNSFVTHDTQVTLEGKNTK